MLNFKIALFVKIMKKEFCDTSDFIYGEAIWAGEM